MKVLKYIALALFALIGILLVIGLCMPKVWSVERSTVVSAEAAKIHPHVGNLEGWPKWMPWMEEDPAMQLSFEGTAGAAGQKMIWKSEKMGNGSLTAVKSDAATGLEYVMRMEEMSEEAHGSICYAKEGGGTRVTWKDEGTLGGNPFMRLMGPLMEGMMNDYFDRGLAKMKALAEQG
ncbi:MAG: SRPBCC family protein [Planctomycetota bacterium]